MLLATGFAWAGCRRCPGEIVRPTPPLAAVSARTALSLPAPAPAASAAVLVRVREPFHTSAIRWRQAPPDGSRPDETPLFDDVKTSSDTSKDDGKSKPRFSSRLRKAWNESPVKWYPIPVGLGLAVVGAQQYLHLRNRPAERCLHHLPEDEKHDLRPSGPWQVHIASALPLKQFSRLWGWFNDITLPMWFREPGFRFYAWIFGCNLEEMEDTNLKNYPNLGSFFYRKLKPGVRPIADSCMVSPADGRVLHFGMIEGRRVEQVKGVTYSLDAFFGKPKKAEVLSPGAADAATSTPVVTEQDFADVNWVCYTLDELLGDAPHKQAATVEGSGEEKEDARLKNENRPDPVSKKHHAVDPKHHLRAGYGLYFCVIYLAPGDYHRFHSPCNWVVESRRHFPGELFSVSPYMAKRLQNLFVVNERVVLLGHWKHGFFSMVPVGATNVGSIVVNFDKNIRTNVRGEKHGGGSYTEVSYKSFLSRFHGLPITKGTEMGGFKLGSTVVLVFEAPLDWKFHVRQGEKVRVGQSLGDVVRPNGTIEKC